MAYPKRFMTPATDIDCTNCTAVVIGLCDMDDRR